jgi:hypothetical protein
VCGPVLKLLTHSFARNLSLMKLSIIISIVVCLSGCAEATSVSIRSPQGDNWIGIDCKGHSQVSCLQEAGEQCPSGYDVMNSEEHFSTASSAVATTQVAVASVHEVHNGSMVIKCHGKSTFELDAEAANKRAASYGSNSGTVWSQR